MSTSITTEEQQLKQATETAENAFGLSLLFSGIRCTLQYAILPFVLPIIGVAGDFSVAITFVINLVAMGAIFFSVKRFWDVNYKYKWHYLPVAGVALTILTFFLVQDLGALL